MNLYVQKTEELYYEIARDSYGFSSSGDTYYPIVVALDRLKECVNILNHTKLEGKYNDDATEFVIWVNYADLLIQCIENIAKSFDYTVQYGNGLQKYHGINGKTDKDFFRFIRAIVLPHALKLDDSKQKDFTQGKKAFCPFTVWDTKGSIRIVYYINLPHDDLHQYTLQLCDLQHFLEDIYNQIDTLCIKVKNKKKKLKERRNVNIKNEKYDRQYTILDKCTFLIDITKKYRDLDDKNELSSDIMHLRRCEKICKMKFYGVNKILYDKYMQALNIALDDYYDNLTKERTDEIYLDLVMVPLYSYDSSSAFSYACAYEINKIVTEMENMDSYFEKYYFVEFYENIKAEMGKLAYFKKNMGMERFCVIVIMLQFFDKLEHNKKYIELNKKMRQISD